MGIIAHDGDDIPLGVECSGVVRRIGSAVGDLQPGDRVFGVARGGMFASRVKVKSDMVVKIPDDMSFEDAATLINHLTAIWSLVDIGRMEPGQVSLRARHALAGLKSVQTILIHSASGGVGQTALQLCRVIGIDADSIFATAGTLAKRKHLNQSWGIPLNHIFDSHSTQFKEGLMQATDNRGVDLVLNSLSGELLHTSWECVAPFGIMVELGKRDLDDYGKLSLQPFLGNRSYSCVDMHHALEYAPQKIQRLLATTMEMYRQGKIGPIRPIKLYDASDAHLALRRLQHADHLGKVVVTLPKDTSVIPRKLRAPAFKFDPEHAYLLVGGLGGLGRVVGKWMVANGARHLVVLSRNPLRTSAHIEAADGLRELGCNVLVVAGRAEDSEDVARALRAAIRPIKGVLHLGMVIRVSLSVSQ